jgi:hypothetical protein
MNLDSMKKKQVAAEEWPLTTSPGRLARKL